MKSLKTKTSVFPLATIVCILLCFCYSPKVLSQSDVFSMKFDATDLLDLRNNNLTVVFTFRKEFISLFGSKYVADGKAFPNTSTKKIELKKDSRVQINSVNFRALFLTKDPMNDFIADLKTKDLIDLNSAGVASNYDIILKADSANEGGKDYIGFTMHARKKGDPITSLSTASRRINPCPPCTY